MPALGAVTPILRIFDIAKAHEFYVGFLGFEIQWEHRFGDDAPLYTEVSRDGCVLHLSEHHGDASPGSAVRIRGRGHRRAEPRIVRKKRGKSRSATRSATAFISSRRRPDTNAGRSPKPERRYPPAAAASFAM